MRLASPTSRDKYRIRVALDDFFWAVASPFIALALRDPNLLSLENFPLRFPETYQYAVISIVCALGCFLVFRLDEHISRFFSIRDAANICGAVACSVASGSLIAFTLTRLEGVPRSTPLIYGLVLASGLVFTRLLTRLFSRAPANHSASQQASDYRRVLIVGVDHFAAAAIKLLDCQRPRTTIVVAVLDSRPSLVGRKISGVKIVGDASDVDEIIQEYVVHGVAFDEVWLSDEAPAPADLVMSISEKCASRDLPFLRISEAFNLLPHPTQYVRPEEHRPLELSDYFELKRILDIFGAAALLAALFPVAAAVACLTLIDVGAPALFWQQRIGRQGRKFLLYKFRTLHAPFDKAGRRIPEELRLSKIGRAIRASRLDEVPQLYNVLIGDMSLIGPRPLLPHDQPSDPRTRLLVRPGISGWAQINGGATIGPEEKDALDIWYIQHASLALDLQILKSTVIFALTGEKRNQSAIEHAVAWREESFNASFAEGNDEKPTEAFRN